jgi:uncharacterized protein YcbX
VGITVTGLAITAVKGTQLQQVRSIVLDPGGARGNRRFCLIDARDRMVNAKHNGDLQRIIADCSGGNLTLEFPDGRVVHGQICLGGHVTTRFYSRSCEARLLVGPWSAAVSDFIGQAVRIVEPVGGGVDRGELGAVSLISRASLREFANAALEPSVDARRFRMLIEVDGVGPHEEDDWVGRNAEIGDAVVRWTGHVGRCVITSRHPETGAIDLPTLDVLRSYRGQTRTTEPLPFGIYGEVLREGWIRVGDSISVRQPWVPAS